MLKKIAAKGKEGAQVVTTDFIIGVDGEKMESTKRLMSVNMLASNPQVQPRGARERTLDEYKLLFSRAGYENEVELIKMRDVVSSVRVTV